MSINKMKNCLNCDHPTSANFCSFCGQKNNTRQLKIKEVFIETCHLIINSDKGLVQTTISLITKPGNVNKEYIAGKRIKYFNPLRFLFFWVTIDAFLILLLSDFGAEGLITASEAMEEYDIINRVNELRSLITFTGIPIFAIFSFLFFKKYNYNFTEHLVLNSYIGGIQSFFGVIYCLGFLIFDPESFNRFYLNIINMIYLIWVYVLFFENKTFSIIMKATGSFLTSYIIWIILMLGILLLFLPSGITSMSINVQ